MAATLIRGSTQILDGSIPLTKLAAGYSIPTTNLAASADFILRTGTVPFTAAQSMGGFKLTSLADATAGTDGVNLQTLQAYASGFGVSKRARLLSTTNLALTGVQTIDSVAGASGDLVWLNAQTTASQNGLWTMLAGAWTRPVGWAAASTQMSSLLFIAQGTVYADTKWTIAADSIVVDTTAITAVQDTTGAAYTADGTKGVLLTGSAFSVKLLSTGGLSFDGSGNTQVLLDGASLSTSATGIKIANGTAGSILMANATGLATYTAVSGDATISNTGVVTVAATGAAGFVKIGKEKFNAVPTGAINGVNATFTIVTTPVTATEAVYLNGQRMFPGAGNDYTISGTAITMLTIPVTGDRLVLDYLEV
jgi:hypothetical protein